MKFNHSSLLRYISKFSLEYKVRHGAQTLVTYVFLLQIKSRKVWFRACPHTCFVLFRTRHMLRKYNWKQKLHESMLKCQIRIYRNTSLEMISIKSVELISQTCDNLNNATTNWLTNRKHKIVSSDTKFVLSLSQNFDERWYHHLNIIWNVYQICSQLVCRILIFKRSRSIINSILQKKMYAQPNNSLYHYKMMLYICIFQ